VKRVIGVAALAGAALVPTLAAGSAHADPPPVAVEERDNGMCLWITHQQGHCIDIAGLQEFLENLLKGQQLLARGLTL
jgi:hypothetical protein